jgi:hypothetical protein
LPDRRIAFIDGLLLEVESNAGDAKQDDKEYECVFHNDSDGFAEKEGKGANLMRPVRGTAKHLLRTTQGRANAGAYLGSSKLGKFAVFVQPNCYAKLLCQKEGNTCPQCSSTAKIIP